MHWLLVPLFVYLYYRAKINAYLFELMVTPTPQESRYVQTGQLEDVNTQSIARDDNLKNQIVALQEDVRGLKNQQLIPVTDAFDVLPIRPFVTAMLNIIKKAPPEYWHLDNMCVLASGPFRHPTFHSNYSPPYILGFKRHDKSDRFSFHVRVKENMLEPSSVPLFNHEYELLHEAVLPIYFRLYDCGRDYEARTELLEKFLAKLGEFQELETKISKTPHETIMTVANPQDVQNVYVGSSNHVLITFSPPCVWDAKLDQATHNRPDGHLLLHIGKATGEEQRFVVIVVNKPNTKENCYLGQLTFSCAGKQKRLTFLSGEATIDTSLAATLVVNPAEQEQIDIKPGSKLLTVEFPNDPAICWDWNFDKIPTEYLSFHNITIEHGKKQFMFKVEKREGFNEAKFLGAIYFLGYNTLLKTTEKRRLAVWQSPILADKNETEIYNRSWRQQ